MPNVRTLTIGGVTYDLQDNISGYLTSETDPVFSVSAAAGISSSDITNWNNKVDKSGDTMTGSLIINASSASKANKLTIGQGNGYSGLYLKQYNTDADDDNDILIRHGAATGTTTPLLCVGRGTKGTGGAVILRGIANPLQDGDAVNKNYIDNAISNITYPVTSVNGQTGAVILTIPTVPTTVSSFTNDAGYLTSSDIASVLTYKGTKANSAALPSSGNTTGDVWHVTDTGAEYAWDGSTWQELGTAVDLSGYLQSGDIASWAKQSTKPSYSLSEITGTSDLQAIEGLTGTSGLLKKTAADTWTLDTNTYLTSFTETDPVFSASAAAGITSSDISNWNGKSSTDEKVKTITYSADNTTHPIVFGNDGATAITETKFASSDLTFAMNDSNYATLTVGKKYNTKGRIWINTGRGNTGEGTYLQSSAINDSKTITFPNATGTVALTSDIISHSTQTATLTTTWTSNQQTVTVSGVTSSNYVVVSPAPASYDDYCEAGIYCSAQGTNSLTFKCDTAPSSSLTVNVMIIG